MITITASKTPAAVLLLLLLPAVLLFNPTTADDFDFYLLAMQWGPGVCSARRCAHPPKQEFTIHGFWPANDENPQPSGEDGRYIPWTLQTFTDSIYRSQIAGLTIALHTSWPQILANGRTDEEFWFNQWKKHGICSPFAPDIYFAEGLKAFTSYNALAGLVSAGFVPADNVLYKAKDLQSAVVGNPTLLCYRSRAGNYYVLTEMRFCFTRDNPSKMDCQSPSLDLDLNSCGGPNGLVLFLPANPLPSSVQINEKDELLLPASI